MPFINTKTLEYPLSEQDIRQRHPSVLFPVPFVAPEGFAPVFASPTPVFDHKTQVVREVAPAQREKDRRWFQAWEVIDIPTKQDTPSDRPSA